eukprot:286893-Rhodomonas_salina.1
MASSRARGCRGSSFSAQPPSSASTSNSTLSANIVCALGRYPHMRASNGSSIPAADGGMSRSGTRTLRSLVPQMSSSAVRVSSAVTPRALVALATVHC